MKLSTLISAASLTLVAFGALAQTPAPAAAPRVEQRQDNQDKRIEAGVASGKLTPLETQRLERQQSNLGKAEDKAAADGTVTAKEKAGLHVMQERTARKIRRNKHDGQTAASAPVVVQPAAAAK
jgi:hypothetical protein